MPKVKTNHCKNLTFNHFIRSKRLEHGDTNKLSFYEANTPAKSWHNDEWERVYQELSENKHNRPKLSTLLIHESFLEDKRDSSLGNHSNNLNIFKPHKWEERKTKKSHFYTPVLSPTVDITEGKSLCFSNTI